MLSLLTTIPAKDGVCFICKKPILDGLGATIFLTPMWPSPEPLKEWNVQPGDLCVELPWEDEAVVHIMCLVAKIPEFAGWQLHLADSP